MIKFWDPDRDADKPKGRWYFPGFVPQVPPCVQRLWLWPARALITAPGKEGDVTKATKDANKNADHLSLKHHCNLCYVNVSISLYGGFHKWGYLQIIYFNGISHYKPSILGYLHLWTPQYIPSMEF